MMHDTTPVFVTVLLGFFIIALIPLLMLATLTFWADTRRLYAKPGDSFKMVISRMLNTSKEV